jgi:predicted transcriptional regulator
MTPNDFLKIIQQETCPVDVIPEGWYCVEDLLKKWNISKTLIHKRINQGKKLGYVTQKKFIVKRGAVRSVPYYRFHEKENNQKINKRENMENTIRPRRKNKRS